MFSKESMHFNNYIYKFALNDMKPMIVGQTFKKALKQLSLLHRFHAKNDCMLPANLLQWKHFSHIPHRKCDWNHESNKNLSVLAFGYTFKYIWTILKCFTDQIPACQILLSNWENKWF